MLLPSHGEVNACRVADDDGLKLMTVQLLAVVQTICTHMAARAGLGKHDSVLSPQSRDRYSKVVGTPYRTAGGI